MDAIDEVKALARAEAERVVAELLREVPPRMATVTGTAPLAVRFWGGDTSTSEVVADGSYTPVVNDNVWVIKVGARWLVAGKVS